MVVQQTLDTLKGKPKDERTAVASGISITFVVVLFVCWGIYFFHKIESGSVNPTFNGAGDQFNASGLQEAQQALDSQAASTSEELQNLRNEAAQSQYGAQQQMQSAPESGGVDQFGNPTSGN